MKAKIETTRAPRPRGPYSQAIETDDYLFVSGVLGVDPLSGRISPDLEIQMEQAMKNLMAILEEANLTLSHVVKVTVYLKNLKSFFLVNEIYSRFFPPPYPARTTVGVSELPLNAEVEIDAIAVKKIS